MNDIIIGDAHGLALASLQIPEAKAKPASHGFDWVIKITFGDVHSAILASSDPFGPHWLNEHGNFAFDD
jgi:hypothetical protein